MSQSMKKKYTPLSLFLYRTLSFLCLYIHISLPSLCLGPRPAICTPHVSSAIAITFLVQYFNDGKLHWALPRLPFHSSRFPVPNSQLPLPVTTQLFRVLQPNSISIMRGKVLCCGFSVTNCFPNLPSFPELMTQL